MSTKPTSPTAWLWAEIERRFGGEAARSLRAAYLLKSREYNNKRLYDVPSPATQPRRGGRKKKR